MALADSRTAAGGLRGADSGWARVSGAASWPSSAWAPGRRRRLFARRSRSASSSSPPPGHAFAQTLWTWISVGGFSPRIELCLDPLSLVMALVVTFVGFLILLYSAEYMDEDEGYSRFFAYMDLFVASMLMLVLAENLLLLYLGWEGVGLCSYLLIGFWYKDAANGRAARKAFIVTRVGDTAMAIGLFLLFTRLGTLDIQSVLRARREPMAAGFRPGRGRGGAAARRRGGQVGAVAAADVAARRHGRPDAGERADPRRDDGDRRRVPDRAHARPLRARPGGAGRRRGHRRGDAPLRRLRGAGAVGHQARPGLFHHQPDRLHVPGARRRARGRRRSSIS